MNKLSSADIKRDFVSSFAVFLVATPVSLGLAIASDVPAILGLISAIIGGLIVGSLSGSKFQINGPSTGLAFMVLHVVSIYGISALVPLGIIVGLFQVVVALMRYGHLFQATPPSLIKAMLSGIGFLLLMSQVFMLLGEKLNSEFYKNIIHFPEILSRVYTTRGPVEFFTPIALAVLVILCLKVANFRRFRKFFDVIPASLFSIILASIVAYAMNLDVQTIQIPLDLTASFASLDYVASFKNLDIQFFLYAIGVSFVASVETMLCVTALDKMTRKTSQYNKTILAQGIGNVIAGLIGTIPVVGVISRSAVNVEMAAKTKLSGILSSVWILLFLFLPGVLGLVPLAALAGMLIHIGYKLLDPLHIFDYVKNYNKTSLIFFTSFALIVSVDLLTGIVAGFLVAMTILLFDVLKFDLQVESVDNNKVLKFTGKLSFLDLPVLHKELADHDDHIPTNIEVCLREVEYLDPAIQEHLDQWKEKLQEKGHTITIKEQESSEDKEEENKEEKKAAEE